MPHRTLYVRHMCLCVYFAFFCVCVFCILICACILHSCVCVYFAKSATRCEGGAKCAWWRPGRSAPHCQLANYFLLLVEVALEVVVVVEVELKVVVVEVALEVVEAEVVHLLSDSKLFSSQLAANCAPVAAQMWKRLDILQLHEEEKRIFQMCKRLNILLLYKEEKRMLQMCKRLNILHPKEEIVANV